MPTNRKRILPKGLTIASLLVSTSWAHAQLAVIDSKKILASMPQIAKADTLLINEQQTYNKEYNLRYSKLQSQLAVADSIYKQNPKDSSVTKTLAKAQQLKDELQTFEQSANKKLADYRSLLYTPYVDKANAAIKTVALRLKYKQALDIQSTQLAWYDPATDITSAVITELKK